MKEAENVDGPVSCERRVRSISAFLVVAYLPLVPGILMTLWAEVARSLGFPESNPHASGLLFVWPLSAIGLGPWLGAAMTSLVLNPRGKALLWAEVVLALLFGAVSVRELF